MNTFLQPVTCPLPCFDSTNPDINPLPYSETAVNIQYQPASLKIESIIMKALLAHHGIRVLALGGMHYAFNDDLLRKRALIEYFSYASGVGTDHDTEFFISVLVRNGKNCTNISFYSQRGPVLQRTIIFCMVAYLVSFIEKCSTASLVTDLQRLAETVPESFQFPSPSCPQAEAAELYKFNLVRKSISAGKEHLVPGQHRNNTIKPLI